MSSIYRSIILQVCIFFMLPVVSFASLAHRKSPPPTPVMTASIKGIWMADDPSMPTVLKPVVEAYAPATPPGYRPVFAVIQELDNGQVDWQKFMEKSAQVLGLRPASGGPDQKLSQWTQFTLHDLGGLHGFVFVVQENIPVGKYRVLLPAQNHPKYKWQLKQVINLEIRN